MSPLKTILFISNGHGEDLVAAELIKELKKQSAPPKTLVLPIVGEGKAFEPLGVEVIGSRQKLPSGGFSLRNPGWLLSDLSAGLISANWNNIRILKKLRGKIDAVVGIGDLVPIIGAIITKAPFIFIGVNKSSYYKTFGYNYTPWEKWLLKRYAKVILVRDQITAEQLKQEDIAAEYLGNPLMDCCGQIQNPNDKIQTMNNFIIGFLPGTRDDVNLNIADFELVAEELSKQPGSTLKFVIATPAKNLKGSRYFKESTPFEGVIAKADIIVGLSGTGNEQAAGFGKPIVAFAGRGSQYNQKFASAQKELLGEALCLTKKDPKIVANEVWKILKNQELYQDMSKTGKERMGSAGACYKIAEEIVRAIKCV
ncbi:MAG: hypothetical protein NT099_04600 [Candidatus Saganbacteria bacterium]|nr:hypothetical protein [Candidatus Saganbacteria bacterium]